MIRRRRKRGRGVSSVADGENEEIRGSSKPGKRSKHEQSQEITQTPAMTLSDESADDADARLLSGRHVVLNVGGVRYHTSISTLTSQSGYFRAMFALRGMSSIGFSEAARTVQDKNNAAEFFVDRDPKPFEHILTYLRTNTANLPRNDEVLFRAVAMEAEFYQISSLVRRIRQGLRKNFQIDDSTSFNDFFAQNFESNMCESYMSLPGVDEMKPMSLAPAPRGAYVETNEGKKLPVSCLALCKTHWGTREVLPLLCSNSNHAFILPPDAEWADPEAEPVLPPTLHNSRSWELKIPREADEATDSETDNDGDDVDVHEDAETEYDGQNPCLCGCLFLCGRFVTTMNSCVTGAVKSVSAVARAWVRGMGMLLQVDGDAV